MDKNKCPKTIRLGKIGKIEKSWMFLGTKPVSRPFIITKSLNSRF